MNSIDATKCLRSKTVVASTSGFMMATPARKSVSTQYSGATRISRFRMKPSGVASLCLAVTKMMKPLTTKKISTPVSPTGNATAGLALSILASLSQAWNATTSMAAKARRYWRETIKSAVSASRKYRSG